MSQPKNQELNTKCLYVRNIPVHIDQAALHDLFVEYGTIRHVSRNDKYPDLPAFGFVEYTDETAAQKAYSYMLRNDLGLKIEFARSRKDRKPNSEASDQSKSSSIQDLLDDAFLKFNEKCKINDSPSQNLNGDHTTFRQNERKRKLPSFSEHQNSSNSHIESRNDNTKEHLPDVRKSQQLQNFLRRHGKSNDALGLQKSATLFPRTQPLRNVGQQKSLSVLNKDCCEHVHHDHSKPEYAETVCSVRSGHPPYEESVSSRENYGGGGYNALKSMHGHLDSDLPRLRKNSYACTLCNKDAPFFCTDCNEPYCSEECQFRDWPRHSMECASNIRCTENNIPLRSNNHLASNSSHLMRNSHFPCHFDGPSCGASPYLSKRDSYYHHKEDSNVRPFDSDACSSSFRDRRFTGDALARTKHFVLQQHNKNLFKMSVSKSPDQSYGSGYSMSSLSPSKRMKLKDMKKTCLHPIIHNLVTVSVCNDPYEFWVVLKEDEKYLQEIECTLSRLKRTKSPFQDPSFGDLCCVWYDDSLYRCSISKVYPRGLYDVYFVDYGHSDVVNGSILYNMSQELIDIPALAVCCKLYNVKPFNDVCGWRSIDVDFFANLVSNRVLRARVQEESGVRTTVELTAEDGFLISSIMVNERHAKWVTILPDVKVNGYTRSETIEKHLNLNENRHQVPSVLEKLAINMEVNISPVFVDDCNLWGWIEDDQLTAQIQDLESELDDGRGEEITLTAIKGDVGAAFSPSHHKWFRCVVIDRTNTSLTVRYIDYGLEEEVPKVFKLPKEQIIVPSPLLCCKMDQLPGSLADIMSEGGFLATIVKLSHTAILGGVIDTMSFHLTAHPWYYGMMGKKEENKISKNSENILSGKLVCKQKYGNKRMPPKLNATRFTKRHSPKKEDKIAPNKRILSIAKDILCDREIPSGRVPVEVVWAKSRAKVFVQKMCDRPNLNKLTVTINEWCTSAEAQRYTPVKGDIVCAKYALDNNWYRSLVLNISAKQAEVFFIDYGNTEIVSVENIKKMKELLNEVKFSILVCLHDLPATISPKDVTEILSDKVLEMEIVDNSSIPKKVLLYENGKNVFSSWRGNQQSVPVLRKGCLEGRIDFFHDSKVRISHIDSSKHFHVQLMSSREEYFKLSRELEGYFKHTPQTSLLPKVDDMVCFPFNDTFYRGYIVQSSAEKCQVKSVDNGFTEDIRTSDIKQLKEVFLKHALCIEVELDGVDASLVATESYENLKSCPLQLKIVNRESLPIKGKFYIEDICVNDALMDEVNEHKDQLRTKFLFKSFKQRSLAVAEVVDVVFYFMEKQKYFLQKVQDAETVASMSDALQTQCSTTSEKCHDLSEGEVVCAKCSDDGLWYRACVTNVLGTGKYCVQFIDYGNSEIISNENIRLLPKKLAELPVFAVCVTFKNAPEVVTCGAVYSVVTSGTEADPVVEIFSNVQRQKTYQLESFQKQTLPLNEKVAVTFQSLEDNMLYLHRVCDSDNIEKMARDLQEVPSQSDQLSLMLKTDDVVCAKCLEDQLWYRASIRKVMDKCCEVFFVDYGNCELVDMQNLRQLPDNVANFPIFAIPVLLKNPQPIVVGQEYLVEVEKGAQQHLIVKTIQLNSSGTDVVSPKSSYSISVFQKQNLPQNEVVNVVFQHCEGEKYFVHKFSDASSDILKLTEMLQNVCSKGKVISRMPSVGDVVCAKCSEDQVWYRASIKNITDGKVYHVTYIDYGNSDDVESKDIQELPEDAAKMPIFAISVLLKNPQAIEVGVPYSVLVGGNEQNPIVEIQSGNAKSNINALKPAVIYNLPTFQKQSLPLNQTIDVVFQSCERNQFFVQKVSDRQRIKDLSSILQKHGLAANLLMRSPVENEVVCARSSGDDTWYRVSINKKLDGETYEVNLIDFGHSEKIKLKDICDLPEDASNIPIFAINVSIDNPQPLTVGVEYLVLVLTDGNTQKIQFVTPEPSYKISDFTCEALTIGEIVEVVFVHQDCAKWFLHKKTDVESIGVMCSLLQSHCSGLEPILRKPIQGEVLCSLSQKSTWGRVSVESVRSDGSFDVFFLDYGYTEQVQKKNLWCLPVDMASLSMFGIAVRAHNSSGIEIGAEHKVKVSGTFRDPIIEILPKMMKINSPSKPPARGESPLKLNQPPKTGLSEHKVPLLSDCAYVDFPCGNVNVIVYSIASYDTVFCAPFDESNIVSNCNLSSEIMEYCESSSLSGYMPVAEREVVLARYHVDGCWYRAAVANIASDTVCVHFLDYGGVSVLNSVDIRKMVPQFMKLPIQAHCCSMDSFDVDDERQEKALTEAVKEELKLDQSWSSIVTKEGDTLSIEFPMLKAKLIQQGLVSA